jgi:hypothetical protein
MLWQSHIESNLCDKQTVTSILRQTDLNWPYRIVRKEGARRKPYIYRRWSSPYRIILSWPWFGKLSSYLL